MKRLLIIACLLISGVALAQSPDGPRITVRFGAGFPGTGPEKFVNGLIPASYGIQGIYDDYYSDTKATPALTAECLYQVNEWLSCGAEVIYGRYSNQRFNGITDKVEAERTGQNFIVMPTAHVSYYQWNLLTLYMGMGVGAGYYSGFDNMTEKLSFEVEFVPLGIEFGGRLFGFAEGCLGTAVNWGRAGIGFRF